MCMIVHQFFLDLFAELYLFEAENAVTPIGNSIMTSLYKLPSLYFASDDDESQLV